MDNPYRSVPPASGLPASSRATSSEPPAPGLTRLRIVYESKDLVLASLGNVHLTLYRATPSVELLTVDQRFHEELAARVGETIVCTTTTFGIALPDSAARSLASALIEKNRGFVRAAATVTEGDGFWASAARSAVTAIFFFAKQPYPSRVFADPLVAGTWIATFTGITAPAIRDAIRAMESRGL